MKRNPDTLLKNAYFFFSSHILLIPWAFHKKHKSLFLCYIQRTAITCLWPCRDTQTDAGRQSARSVTGAIAGVAGPCTRTCARECPRAHLPTSSQPAPFEVKHSVPCSSSTCVTLALIWSPQRPVNASLLMLSQAAAGFKKWPTSSAPYLRLSLRNYPEVV